MSERRDIDLSLSSASDPHAIIAAIEAQRRREERDDDKLHAMRQPLTDNASLNAAHHATRDSSASLSEAQREINRRGARRALAMLKGRRT